MSIWEYANPKKFITTTTPVMPWVFGVAGACLLVGVIWGLFFVPDADRFEDSVKIFFIHVSSATMAVNAWAMMLITSLIWLIRRHHVSALAAKAAAPVGLAMTAIGLVTGMIWGEPMWGSYWAWDPRLTAFLILALFYLGYIALWEAIEDPDTAADLTSILCIVGSIFAFLSRYAVRFWSQGLHQGTTVPVVTGGRSIANVYFYPLLITGAGFAALFLALVLLRTRTEIRLRRARALEARLERGQAT